MFADASEEFILTGWTLLLPEDALRLVLRVEQVQRHGEAMTVEMLLAPLGGLQAPLGRWADSAGTAEQAEQGQLARLDRYLAGLPAFAQHGLAYPVSMGQLLALLEQVGVLKRATEGVEYRWSIARPMSRADEVLDLPEGALGGIERVRWFTMAAVPGFTALLPHLWDMGKPAVLECTLAGLAADCEVAEESVRAALQHGIEMNYWTVTAPVSQGQAVRADPERVSSSTVVTVMLDWEFLDRVLARQTG
ncbi:MULTISPECIES: DUF6042 family protein [unclassified Crossiella]|uniref:DUF6042 family protein n=1 Tax=unclassified Crossiella TaxID=2620835 RepID=UPI001FFE5E3C|nr:MULTISPECIES: DUF6042 family protein [unclassified Crossiella]MCK2239991.1 DUF6042 family protein [Crossiella sp. S99.2]MCK2252699.1 DUF6042 family protein [Crossiella sp. S99.1]